MKKNCFKIKDYFKNVDSKVSKIIVLHIFCISMLTINYWQSILTTTSDYFILSYMLYVSVTTYIIFNYKYIYLSLSMYKTKHYKYYKFLNGIYNTSFILLIMILFTNKSYIDNDLMGLFIKILYDPIKNSGFGTLFILVTLVLSLGLIDIFSAIYQYKKNFINSPIMKVDNIRGMKFIFVFIKYELIFTFLFIILDCNCYLIELFLVPILGFWIIPTIKDIKEKIEDESFKIKIKHIIEYKKEN